MFVLYFYFAWLFIIEDYYRVLQLQLKIFPSHFSHGMFTMVFYGTSRNNIVSIYSELNI